MVVLCSFPCLTWDFLSTGTDNICLCFCSKILQEYIDIRLDDVDYSPPVVCPCVSDTCLASSGDNDNSYCR